jgi:hypothetical protein
MTTHRRKTRTIRALILGIFLIVNLSGSALPQGTMGSGSAGSGTFGGAGQAPQTGPVLIFSNIAENERVAIR